MDDEETFEVLPMEEILRWMAYLTLDQLKALTLIVDLAIFQWTVGSDKSAAQEPEPADEVDHPETS